VPTSVIFDEEWISLQFGFVEFEHEHLAKKKAIGRKLVVREFLD
jgi:hypothetical protein